MEELQMEQTKESRRCRKLPGGRWLITLAGVAALFLLAGLLLGQVVVANTGVVPGSEQDPLVTASWVEARLDAFARGGVQPLPSQPGEAVRIVEPAPAYTVVVVEAGKKMLPGEGTEFILRSGQAKAVVPIEGNGLTNLTAGRNLEAGDRIERNHLILCPREDGRGVITETETIFLVRGKYRII